MSIQQSRLSAKIKATDIVHQYFSISDCEKMLEFLGEEYEIDPDDYTLNHFFIYINLPKPIILVHLKGDEKLFHRTKSLQDCKGLLLSLFFINFDSVLFVLSAYHVVGLTDIRFLLRATVLINHTILYDDLFDRTFRYLFYKHQLEGLISRITDDKFIDPKELRRGWNKKDPTAIAIMNELMVFPGVSLTEFIKQRTVEKNHFVWSPNYRGAQKLWNYLNNENQSV